METKQKGSITIMDEGDRLRVEVAFDPPNCPVLHPVAVSLLAAYKYIIDLEEPLAPPVATDKLEESK
jgi:hypothetical protein